MTTGAHCTEDHFGELHNDVREIKEALVGNGLGASKGLIPRVETLERADEKMAVEIRGLRQQWLRVKWVAFGMGLGAGLGGGGLALGISRIFPGGP